MEASITICASAFVISSMAYQELPNYSIHAASAPWGEETFQKILAVSCNATAQDIKEAAARKLVEIPTVSAQMDVYTRDAPRCWSERADIQQRFFELLEAYATVETTSDKRQKVSAASNSRKAPVDPYAVLDVQPGVDPTALDKALKIKLLSIPNNTRIWETMLYHGGQRREEEACFYPIDDMVN